MTFWRGSTIYKFGNIIILSEFIALFWLINYHGWLSGMEKLDSPGSIISQRVIKCPVCLLCLDILSFYLFALYQIVDHPLFIGFIKSLSWLEVIYQSNGGFQPCNLIGGCTGQRGGIWRCPFYLDQSKNFDHELFVCA